MFYYNSSDESNDKMNKEIVLRIIPDTEVAEGAHGQPIFCVEKNKKIKQKEKRKSFKAETIKRLPPMLKFYCFSNKFEWWVFHGPSTLKSISPALPDLALMCAPLHWNLICLRCVLGGIFSYVAI